jgi:hypothetical protein
LAKRGGDEGEGEWLAQLPIYLGGLVELKTKYDDVMGLLEGMADELWNRML